MVRKILEIGAGVLLALMTLTVSVSTVSNTGCTVKTDTLFVHDTTYLSAVFVAFIDENDQEAFLFSDPVADLASSHVVIEWDTNTYIFSEKGIGRGYIFFGDTLSLLVGAPYTLRLTTNLGECQGTFTIPDTANITQPTSDDTMSLGSNILVSWNKISNASFYELHYSFSAYDSGGYWIDYGYADTILMDTIFTIPASFFNVPDAAFYQASIYVYPYQGPALEAGATSNTQGSIKGFLYAGGEGDYVYIYVGTPTRKSGYFKIPEPTKEAIRGAILKKLGLR
ncbi:MAG: hypothetical protein QMD82_02735 [bacterium]|nr:hypothetical protein [bacterium]